MIKIYNYGQVSNDEIFARAVPEVNVEQVVAEILANVKANGDNALYEYCAKFDHANLTALQVTEEEINEAVAQVDKEFLKILEKAAVNIRKFHSRQVRNSFMINDQDGIVIGQKIIPVDRAGLYHHLHLLIVLKPDNPKKLPNFLNNEFDHLELFR